MERRVLKILYKPMAMVHDNQGNLKCEYPVNFGKSDSLYYARLIIYAVLY